MAWKWKQVKSEVSCFSNESKNNKRAEEMVQQLEAWATLPEDWDLIHSTYYSEAHNQSFRHPLDASVSNAVIWCRDKNAVKTPNT